MNDKRSTRPVVENPDSVTHWTCPDAPTGAIMHFMERNLFGNRGVVRCRYCKRSETALRNEQTAILANGAPHRPEAISPLARELRRMSRMRSLFNPTIGMPEIYRETLQKAAAALAAAEKRASLKPEIADSILEQIIRDFWDEEIETLPESEQDEVALASRIRAAGYGKVEVTDEMVVRFKVAWHEANARLEMGNRVRAGLRAALAGAVSETEPTPVAALSAQLRAARATIAEARREAELWPGSDVEAQAGAALQRVTIALSRTETPTDHSELIEAVQAARRAADGNSNDEEIQLLQDALDRALGALGLDIPEPTNDEEEEEKK